MSTAPVLDHARPLLVGEANPYGGDPRFSLYPRPVNSAGWRLCHKVLGLTPGVYLARFDRVNLCPEEWRVGTAREKALELLRSRTNLVLLGAKVAHAFGLLHRPFTRWNQAGVTIYQLPHPSGRCHVWNNPATAEQARELLREFLL